MRARPVMISLALTLMPMLGSQMLLRPSAAGPSEPSAPIDAGAVVEAIVGSESQLQARVRISLTSMLQDAEVTLEAEPRHPGERPTPLGHMALSRGRKQDLRAIVDIEPGVNNELSFTARARKADGTEELQSIYLQVPLDPSTQPEVVDEFLQYRGSVQPAGGGQ